MNRKATQEQNDISLIFGNLPKRLQMKIAANCNNAADDALEEEDAGNEILTNGRLAVLSAKNSEYRNHVTNEPVLDASGSTCKSKPAKTTTSTPCEYVIPGILRLNASNAVQLKQGRQQTNSKKQNNATTRRRGKTQSYRILESVERDPNVYLATSPVRVRLTTEHPIWFEQLMAMPDMNGVIKLYDHLMILQERNLLIVNWDNFCEIHEKLQRAFKKLILDHLKFACEQKIDAFFWKLLLYNIREYLKAQKTENAMKRIPPLIDQSQNFYATLYDDLKEKFFSSTRYENIAKVIGQRLLICIGDLSRYRACHAHSNDFSDTFKYYHQAQALIPSNGAPYNQLAIVAVHARKKFDAVYYYMRSLLTSNAIQSAKESLLDLFDDIRKKYEETELKRSPLHHNSVQHRNAASMRKEVWIYPDGVRRLHRTEVKSHNKNKATIAEQERFDDMPTDELLRRIINLYLYLIGKFYMGIGVENVYQHLRKLLIELTAALNHRNLLTRSKVLKIVALNIFVVEHNKLKESRREVRYHAFNFSNAIFGLMLRKANQILVTPKKLDNLDGLEDEFVELNTVLQFIRVYVQWLSINVDIWESVRSEEHSFIDCWHELQQLFRNIARIFEKHEDDFDIKLKHVLLDEDVYLNGFVPLGRDNVSACSTPAQESLQFLKRLKKIAEFKEYFEEYQDCLRMSLSSSFVLEELNTDMQAVLSDLTDKHDDDELRLSGGVADNNENVAPCSSNVLSVSPTSQSASLSQLSKLKRQLEEKTKAKQLCNAKLEEILKFVDTKLYIEVRPRYLLPDTNCFIDCLEDFERLATEFTRYTLIIPLTVVKELDGLSKGVKLDLSKYAMQKQRIHHFDEVSSRAKKTLEFIKKAKNNVKCATTKGSIINASLFGLVEEEYASNDDKILATAVSLFKNLSTETCKDGKCLIQTELVLITTDRNLRVKALSRNLAVSALDEFLQWAKNSNES